MSRLSKNIIYNLLGQILLLIIGFVAVKCMCISPFVILANGVGGSILAIVSSHPILLMGSDYIVALTFF